MEARSDLRKAFFDGVLDGGFDLFIKDLQQERDIKIEQNVTVRDFEIAGGTVSSRRQPDMCFVVFPIHDQVLHLVLVFLLVLFDELLYPAFGFVFRERMFDLDRHAPTDAKRAPVVQI